MPKLKTHKGTAKRIKKSATGKLMRERAYGNHLLQKKSASRKRVIGKAHAVKSANTNNIKRALGK
jgi:large subunit ribosomal protein L35